MPTKCLPSATKSADMPIYDYVTRYCINRKVNKYTEQYTLLFMGRLWDSVTLSTQIFPHIVTINGWDPVGLPHFVRNYGEPCSPPFMS